MTREAFEKQLHAFYDALTVSELHVGYVRAWDACDVESAREVCRALRRRGAPVSYRWGSN